jgi:phage N-6-adenine-methyltransferase
MSDRTKTRQDYAAPRAFTEACERRFGPLTWDLAASEINAKAPRFLSEEQDSLKQDWLSLPGNLWLNPPFANIAPWAAKCAAARDRAGWLLMLTPASIGTNWFEEHVLGKAYVLGVPRLTFVGEKDPYPKDLMLTLWGYGVSGFGAWDWKVA